MRLSQIAFAVAASLTGRSFMAEAAPASEGKVKFASKEYDLDTGMFEITFGDGTVISQNVDELPDEMKRNLMFHGFGQKVGDSYAGAKGDFSKAKSAASDVIEQLKNGDWRAGRDGEAKPRLGELADAIARVKGIEVAEARAAVDAAAALDGTDEQKKAGAEKLKNWRAHPRIKAALAAIRAEKAQADLEASGNTSELTL